MVSKVNNAVEDWNSRVLELVFLLQGHCFKVTVAPRLCDDAAVNSDV